MRDTRLVPAPRAVQVSRGSDFAWLIAVVFLVVSFVGLFPALCCMPASGFGSVIALIDGDQWDALAGAGIYLVLALGMAQAWFYWRRVGGHIASARLWWASTALYNGLACVGSVGVFVADGSPGGLLGGVWFGALSGLALIARADEPEHERRARATSTSDGRAHKEAGSCESGSARPSARGAWFYGLGGPAFEWPAR